MTLHSITKFIPLTKQTDPNEFPRGEYQPYPRMMVRKDNGKPFTDASGRNPVIVQDEDEEAAFRAAHDGEVRDNVPSGASMQDELTKLREENARLKEAAQGGDAAAKPAATSVSSLVKPPVEDADPKPAARPAPRPGRKLD